jgi:hypothetical protein
LSTPEGIDRTAPFGILTTRWLPFPVRSVPPARTKARTASACLTFRGNGGKTTTSGSAGRSGCCGRRP